MANPRSTTVILHTQDRLRVERLQTRVLRARFKAGKRPARIPSQNAVFRSLLKMVSTSPHLTEEWLRVVDPTDE